MQAETMGIVIASDHAGYHLKEHIKKILESLGHSFQDLGTDNPESVDYPDYAARVAREVQDGRRGRMSIAANKFEGVRVALCHDPYSAKMSREHNDSNVLILGGRTMVNLDQVREIVEVWLQTDFHGGRHQRRLDKIKEIEKRN